MQQMFAMSFAGQENPPTLMMRRLRRRQEALVGRPRGQLFLAVLPDAETSARIAQTARHLRVSHGLAGRPKPAESFYVGLCRIDEALDLSLGRSESVKERVARVVMPAFTVGFDRALSFRNGALVLRGEDGVMGLEILQQRLSDALDSRPRKARPFTPHITLLHDAYRVPEQHVAQIEWTVRELVLMQRALGRTPPRQLARWSLGEA